MARPTKQGVDYFPLDVHLDDKFKFIEIKYKLEGFAILIKLFQKIYSCGYWYRWTEDEALLFSDEIRADYDLVEKVVNECLERDVFNKELHQQHKILTSKGIQKRYKEIVRRRKDVEVITEYLLIDNINSVNDDINPSERQHNDGKSTQSKVKKTKQKGNKKERETIAFRDNVFLTQKEYDRLLEKYGQDRTDKMLDKLDSYKGSSGKTYENDSKAITSWVVDEILKKYPLKTEQEYADEYTQDRNVVSQVNGCLF